MISDKEESKQTKLVHLHRTDSNEFFKIFTTMIDDIQEQIMRLQRDKQLNTQLVEQQTTQGIMDLMMGKEPDKKPVAETRKSQQDILAELIKGRGKAIKHKN